MILPLGYEIEAIGDQSAAWRSSEKNSATPSKLKRMMLSGSNMPKSATVEARPCRLPLASTISLVNIIPISHVPAASFGAGGLEPRQGRPLITSSLNCVFPPRKRCKGVSMQRKDRPWLEIFRLSPLVA